MSELLLGIFLVLSSIGVITLKNPVHASLSFLLTLLSLATIYIELAAEFIGISQVLVYAGAILVIFMFVIILFQDAHYELLRVKPQVNRGIIYITGLFFLIAVGFFLKQLIPIPIAEPLLLPSYGTVEHLGKALYIDFFFPFEAVVFLFLVSIVGALYMGKKEIN